MNKYIYLISKISTIHNENYSEYFTLIDKCTFENDILKCPLKNKFNNKIYDLLISTNNKNDHNKIVKIINNDIVETYYYKLNKIEYSYNKNYIGKGLKNINENDIKENLANEIGEQLYKNFLIYLNKKKYQTTFNNTFNYDKKYDNKIVDLTDDNIQKYTNFYKDKYIWLGRQWSIYLHTENPDEDSEKDNMINNLAIAFFDWLTHRKDNQSDNFPLQGTAPIV